MEAKNANRESDVMILHLGFPKELFTLEWMR